MPFIPVPNVVQVQMVYNWNGQAVENVFNYEFAVEPTVTNLTDLAASMVDWWDANLKSSSPTNFTLEKVIATDLTTDSSPGIEYGIGLPLQGTSIDPVLPGNVTLAIKWSTGLRGRSYRGRTYHMPIKRGWVTDSAVDDSSAAGLVATYSLLPDITAGVVTPKMVVVSRFHNKLPRSTGVATEIIGVSADLTIDSQRRRLPGRGA